MWARMQEDTSAPIRNMMAIMKDVAILQACHLSAHVGGFLHGPLLEPREELCLAQNNASTA
jgi:hypothetical protein